MVTVGILQSLSESPPRLVRHIAFADALRAFAIACVVFSHIALKYPHQFSIYRLDVMDVLSHLGEVGVAWLFALSGFLLGQEYLRAILTGEAVQNMRRFLWKRVLRIYPLYACVLLLIFGLQVAAPFGLSLSRYGGFTVPDLIAHLLLIHNISREFVLLIASPMWTMAVDADFYVILPLAMALLARLCLRASPERRIRMLAVAAASIVVLSLLFRAIVVARYPDVVMYYPVQVQILQSVFGFAPLFIAGMIAAVLNLRAVQQTSKRHWPGSLAAAAAVFVVNGVLLHAEPHLPDALSPAWFAWWVFQAVFVAVGAFLSLDALRRIRNPRVLAVFDSRGMREAANLSYAVYLIHFPIIEVIYSWTARIESIWLSLGTTTILVYLISGLLALPLHRYIEVPFLKRKSRIAA